MFIWTFFFTSMRFNKRKSVSQSCSIVTDLPWPVCVYLYVCWTWLWAVLNSVAKSPVFWRCRISAPVSRLPEGSRPGDRISHIWLQADTDSLNLQALWLESTPCRMVWRTQIIYATNALLRSAYFCRNSTLFWTTVFNCIGTVHCGSRRALAS